MFESFYKHQKKEVRIFSPSLARVYGQMMADFRLNPQTSGYDQLNTNHGFEDQTLKGVIHRMYWWFPTHFFKFQDALLNWEYMCRKDNRLFLLDCSRVTFIDLGCGSGAASIALLSLLEQYQAYKISRAQTIHEIHVELIALDPFQTELDVYNQVISNYSKDLKLHRIQIKHCLLCEKFPEGANLIIEELNGQVGHNLIIGMSNLINWIWTESDPYWVQKDKKTLEKLTPRESSALSKIVAQTNFDVAHIIGVATKNNNRWYLPDKLALFLQKVVIRFGLFNRSEGRRLGTNNEVVFENPTGSRWAKLRSVASARYFVENLSTVDTDFINDSMLHDVLSFDYLEAAWAKVRTHMRYESLVDMVELKLFEVNLEKNLRQLQTNCLERNYELLNVEYDLPYNYPKNQKITRPRSLPRFEDQILSVAVCLRFADEMKGNYAHVSYSHRLAQFSSEFLYEYWFQQYRAYLTDIQKNLDLHQVCLVDIKSFYTNINQITLCNEIEARLKTSPRCYELLSQTVIRDCHPPHTHRFGLIQGHIIAGLLANVLLQRLDSRLVTNYKMGGRFFRFADDMTVTSSVDPLADIKNISTSLSLIDNALELNGNKEFKGSATQYSKKIRSPSELNTLSRRFSTLLLPVFVLNLSYIREFYNSRPQFIHEYQQTLEDIGIYLSPEWLHRKLDEFSEPGNWLQKTMKRRKWRLRWPSYNLLHTAVGKREWFTEFRLKNDLWIREKGALQSSLVRMFNNSYTLLMSQSVKDDNVRVHQRNMKFSLYRLNVLGIEEIADKVALMVIRQPWNINVKIACSGLARAGKQHLLENIITGTELAFVRAMAFKAIGSIRDDKTAMLLCNVIDNPQYTIIEKLMASEALLDVNSWWQVSFERVESWISQFQATPYLQKNFIIMLGQAYPQEAHSHLSKMMVRSPHPIIYQAIQYSLTRTSTENLLKRPEPELLRKYRAKYYPEIEELLNEKGSSPAISLF